MSVISASIPVIFCEGEDGGPDVILIKQVLPDELTKRPFVKPVGGKRSFPSYIDGYISSYGSTSPNYIAIRDRDFDKEPSNSASIIHMHKSKPIWATYRACIENYMIDSSLLNEYLSSLARYPGIVEHKPSQQVIEEIIGNSAKEIAAYQTVRWSLASLKPGERWPELGTTWRKDGSGDLPAKLGMDDCIREGVKHIEQYKQDTNKITQQKFESSVKNEFYPRFSKPDFFLNREYLVWFHGKDMFTQIFRKLRQEYKKSNIDFPSNDLQEPFKRWAAAKINIINYPDLAQLREKIKKLSD